MLMNLGLYVEKTEPNIVGRYYKFIAKFPEEQ